MSKGSLLRSKRSSNEAQQIQNRTSKRSNRTEKQRWVLLSQPPAHSLFLTVESRSSFTVASSPIPRPAKHFNLPAGAPPVPLRRSTPASSSHASISSKFSMVSPSQNPLLVKPSVGPVAASAATPIRVALRSRLEAARRPRQR